jgi:hypothetical protein
MQLTGYGFVTFNWYSAFFGSAADGVNWVRKLVIGSDADNW